MYSTQIQTPLGALHLTASTQGLLSAQFGLYSGGVQTSSLLDEASRQVQQYFAGQRTVFDLPLDIRGTEFQRKVWQILREIPWGETQSYGQIAAAVANPKASRAVGGACGANPLVLFIPCHRVLAGDGKLGGFSSGLDIKRKLLQLEGIAWRG